MHFVSFPDVFCSLVCVQYNTRSGRGMKRCSERKLKNKTKGMPGNEAKTCSHSHDIASV